MGLEQRRCRLELPRFAAGDSSGAMLPAKWAVATRPSARLGHHQVRERSQPVHTQNTSRCDPP